jgi:CheY-like chemotaxis protein
MKYLPPKRPTIPKMQTGELPKQAVLYVEDDPDNHQVARARLASKYDVLIAPSDRDACELLTKYGPKIILILMDIELKGSVLDGVALTRLLRGKLDAGKIPHYAVSTSAIEIPILFVTAYGQRFSQDELLGAGADAVIQKPIDFVRLQTAMTRAHLSRMNR